MWFERDVKFASSLSFNVWILTCSCIEMLFLILIVNTKNLVDFVNCHFDLRRYVILNWCIYMFFHLMSSRLKSDVEFITDDIDLSLVFFFFIDMFLWRFWFNRWHFIVFVSNDLCSWIFSQLFWMKRCEDLLSVCNFVMDFENFVFGIRSYHHFLCIFFSFIDISTTVIISR